MTTAMRNMMHGLGWTDEEIDETLAVLSMDAGIVDDDDDSMPVTQGSTGATGGTIWTGGPLPHISGGGWPNFNTGSASPTPPGSINFSLSAPGSSLITLTPSVPKTSVRYVIVGSGGGPCLELEEQPTMTPREMMNICKFLALVSKSGVSNVPTVWSDIVDDLGIDRHFVSGELHYKDYDNNTPVLYIYLHDQP